MKKKPAQGKSLIEFVQAKRRAACRVCQLPPDVLEEIKVAKTKKITRATVLEWLSKERGIKIASADLDVHYSGRHANGV